MDHSEPVISAALTRARQEHARHGVLSGTLVQTVVHTEVPTETEVPVVKPKRTTKRKVVD